MRHRRFLRNLAVLLLNVFLVSMAGRALATDYFLARSFTSSNSGGTGPFSDASGIAVESAGNVYLADQLGSRIDVLDGTGAPIRQINGVTVTLVNGIPVGDTTNALLFPQGVTVDSSVNVWVADTYNRQIKKFTSTGTFIQKFGDPGQLFNPTDLALDPAGDVWVTDVNQIVEYTSSGTFVKKINLVGNLEGIGFDPAGNIWIANHNSPAQVNLQEFTTAGTQLPALTPYIGLSDKDVNPGSLTFDSHGNLWVADAGNGGRVIEFDANGNTLQKFGFGGSVGSFISPSGIAVDPMGNVWVSDNLSKRIQEFSPVPEPATGLTATIAGGALAVVYRKTKKARKA
jgi:tripartite motif-containing protein 71